MDDLPICEAFPVSDQYTDALGQVEVTRSNVRLSFVTERAKDHGTDRELTARIVLPVESVLPAIQDILSANIFRMTDVFRMLNDIVDRRASARIRL